MCVMQGRLLTKLLRLALQLQLLLLVVVVLEVLKLRNIATLRLGLARSVMRIQEATRRCGPFGA